MAGAPVGARRVHRRRRLPETKRELASRASTELLTHARRRPLREEKVADVDILLDRYLTYSRDATFENDWCDAVERTYAEAAGCGLRALASRGARAWRWR